MTIITYTVGFLAYLIGAIPTGYWFAQCKGISDIRKHGSGNIGATNIARTLGKKYFLLIFILDASKAYLFIYLTQPHFHFYYLYIFAGILLFGNGCSLFLQGSGGKGVSTLCGLLIALNPKAALILFGLWSLLFLVIQIVGVASVCTVIFLPFFAYATHDQLFFLFSLYCAFWIVYTHRSNIMSYWNKH